MIINIDLGMVPGCKFIGCTGNGFNGFKQTPTRLFSFLKRAVVGFFQCFFDSLLEFIKAEKGTVPELGNNPSFNILDFFFNCDCPWVYGLRPG